MKNRYNVSFTDPQVKYLRAVSSLSGNSVGSILRTAISNEMHKNTELAKARADKKYLQAFGGRELDNK